MQTENLTYEDLQGNQEANVTTTSLESENVEVSLVLRKGHGKIKYKLKEIKNLGNGWSIRAVQRMDGRKAGKYEIYYYNRLFKRKLRSKSGILKMVERTGLEVDMSLFEFSQNKLKERGILKLPDTPGPKSKFAPARKKSVKNQNMVAPVDLKAPSGKVDQREGSSSNECHKKKRIKCSSGEFQETKQQKVRVKPNQRLEQKLETLLEEAIDKMSQIIDTSTVIPNKLSLTPTVGSTRSSGTATFSSTKSSSTVVINSTRSSGTASISSTRSSGTTTISSNRSSSTTTISSTRSSGTAAANSTRSSGTATISSTRLSGTAATRSSGMATISSTRLSGTAATRSSGTAAASSIRSSGASTIRSTRSSGTATVKSTRSSGTTAASSTRSSGTATVSSTRSSGASTIRSTRPSCASTIRSTRPSSSVHKGASLEIVTQTKMTSFSESGTQTETWDDLFTHLKLVTENERLLKERLSRLQQNVHRLFQCVCDSDTELGEVNDIEQSLKDFLEKAEEDFKMK